MIVFDTELVITDIARAPNDYRAMGLPARSHSMHYEQLMGGAGFATAVLA